jgi:hypothetical protein
MSSINQEFVPYEQAVELKKIGFDEPCICYYNYNGDFESVGCFIKNSELEEDETCAPIFDQAFRWFRERKLLGLVCPIDDWNSWSYSIQGEDCMSPFFQMVYGEEYKTYEEAQLECLKRLIQEYDQ